MGYENIEPLPQQTQDGLYIRYPGPEVVSSPLLAAPSVQGSP